MKKTLLNVSCVLALAILPASAVNYPGTGNVNGTPTDGARIGSVDVNNTASDITFTINSPDTMAAWIFYAVNIQIIGQAGSGYTGLSNPIWGGSPTLGISSGENAVLDFNNDGANNLGGIPFKYSGGIWVAGSSVVYAAGGAGFNYATLTVPLADLGLSLGDSFYFDVVSTYTSWSSGGPQSAYGALANTGWPAETDGLYTPWNGVSSYDSATDAGGTTFGTEATKYTVVPEPATCALLGMGALVFIRRFRRTA